MKRIISFDVNRFLIRSTTRAGKISVHAEAVGLQPGNLFCVRNLTIRLIAVLISFFVLQESRAQDYSFSQFHALPLMRNPALGGLFTGNIRLQAAYRNQWQSVTVPFRSSALSAEYKLASENVTLGLQITHDIAGDSKLQRVQLFPSISGHIDLNESTMLTGGFMGGVVSSRYDPAALQWDDQFVNGQFSASNPTRQVVTNSSRNYLDMSAGLSLLSDVGADGRWYIGMAMYHVSRPSIDFAKTDQFRLNRRWAFNAGITVPANEFGALNGYLDYYIQGGHRQLLLGAFYTHDLVQYDEDERITLSLGALSRWNDAVIPMIKLDYYEMNIGMSYDVNISKLKTASQYRGGFELTIGYRGFLSRRNSSVEKMRCFEPM